jgi:hypothetical protein
MMNHIVASSHTQAVLQASGQKWMILYFFDFRASVELQTVANTRESKPMGNLMTYRFVLHYLIDLGGINERQEPNGLLPSST